MKYAEIIILRNHANLDQMFTYEIPPKLLGEVEVGSRVMVPFGREALEGVVYGLKETCELAQDKIKKILFCFEPALSLPKSFIDLSYFLKDQYLCTFAEAIQLMLPTGTLIETTTKYTKVSGDFPVDPGQMTKSLMAVLNQFQNQSCLFYEEVTSAYSETLLKNNLKRLVALGILEAEIVYTQKIKDRYIERYVVKGNINEWLAKVPSHHKAKVRALEFLKSESQGLINHLRDKVSMTKSVKDWLVKQGIIEIELIEDRRLPAFMSSKTAMRQATLNEEQNQVFQGIWSNFMQGDETPVLLRGVTGSGKTEVYMSLISKTIEMGKKAIFLLPEIALTPQMVSRLAKRFEGSNIALMHSKLSPGERFDQWKAIRLGEVDIILGARSAIFTPLDQVGLIIVDESHEHTYRSERRPKFDTYEVASYMASKSNALLIAGSATPTVESTYESQLGIRKSYQLTKRFNQKPLPEAEIIDMREELKSGNKEILSRRLYEAIQARLDKGEQSLIFLNRTGHSTFVTCRSCGFTLECPNCDITMTYHKHDHKMSCHYCNYEMFVPRFCPKCGSNYFKHFGAGTEKLEETLNKHFPNAVIGRMDRNTTRKKGSFEAMIERVESEEIDILVGTQMIAKGLDFKQITLVGIISVDLMMNMPHFQAGELTYQMVQQVSGRSGRGDLEGEVLLQTYQPDHYAINLVDYEAFYDAEIELRQKLHYPPFCRMVNLIFSSKEQAVAKDYAAKAHDYLKDNLLKKGLQSKVELYPAHPALLKRIDGMYRFQVLLKVDHAYFDIIKRWVDKLQTRFVQIDQCKINIDLNAKNIL